MRVDPATIGAHSLARGPQSVIKCVVLRDKFSQGHVAWPVNFVILDGAEVGFLAVVARPVIRYARSLPRKPFVEDALASRDHTHIGHVER